MLHKITNQFWTKPEDISEIFHRLDGKKYNVFIVVDGREYNLGFFETKQEAEKWLGNTADSLNKASNDFSFGFGEDKE